MSNNNKVFRVAVIANLDEREWRVLTSVTRLTDGRPRAYLFEELSGKSPDIYLVDGENAHSVQSWQAISAWNHAPAMLLKSTPDDSPGKWEFTRQLSPSCLLKLVKMLDQISTQELGYLPELNIGREDSASVPSLAANAAAAAFPVTETSIFSALVVDDSSTVRAQVGLGLKLFGVSADFAESAEQAFELLEIRNYDIAFLDVVLPGADGYQICKSIKKNAKHRQTTVIMLTSKSSAFDRVKASLAGCDSFLTKPVENEQFQQVLKKYLIDNAKPKTGLS